MADDDPFEKPPERLYFMALEQVFLELRGSPLTLSPKDWQQARSWHDEGIPLELVERVMREVFERRREKGTEKKVLHLAFCRRAVEAAWERQRKLAAPEVTLPKIDVAARLAALAAKVPAALPGHDAFVRRLVALEGSAAAVEEDLTRLDAELLETAAAALDDAGRRELEAAVEKALARVRSPAGSEEREEVETRTRERLLRKRSGLPLLSLFAPEATGD